MARLECVEAIYDTLAAAGLRTDHACFDDLVHGCDLVATDPDWQGKGVAEAIAEHDPDRSETSIALDLVDYAYDCKLTVPIRKVVRDAIARGMAGFAE